MSPDVTRAIAWAKAPITSRDCFGYGRMARGCYCSTADIRRLTEIGPCCAEHYLRLPSCERCGMPVVEVTNRRYNWPGIGPGAARKGKPGIPSTKGAQLCRACSCADDSEYLADERVRAMRARSNYPALDECAVMSF